MINNKDKFNAIHEVLQENYEIGNEEISLVLEKYLMMNGRFSLCGSTHKKLSLCVDDDFRILDNIAYTLGIPFKNEML